MADTNTDGKSDNGIYYREQAAVASDASPLPSYPVLDGNTVTVSEDVTKTDMNNAKTNAPKLTFTAYAVQKAGFDTADDAWIEASSL